jgi:OOP family OmpA-OmpF porin
MNLSSVEAAAPQNPANFGGALTKDYATLASQLANQDHDWADSDYFSRKGLAAAHGEVVPPENNANWLVPLEVPYHYRSDLASSRARLVQVLDGGARQRAPLVAARAQVSYDCWVERMEDDWKTAIDGPCHKEFLAAMNQLEAKPAAQPPAPAQPAPTAAMHEYRVYFEFSKATLMPEARQIIKRVADVAKNDNNLKIVLVGKADRAGPSSYNLKLSQRRADAVASELAKDGVARNRIETQWVGERQPPVPTANGVREPRNRVVEITLH